MIDIKDLRPMTASELQVGGVFYRKDPDGFHRCQISADELKNPERAQELRLATAQFSKEGRLFVRINAPFKGFS